MVKLIYCKTTACHANCATCTGPNNNQCVTCSSSAFILNVSTTCVIDCGDGYYKDTSDRTCKSMSLLLIIIILKL